MAEKAEKRIIISLSNRVLATYNEIREDTGYARSTIYLALMKLKRAGFVMYLRDRKNRGRPRTVWAYLDS